jgi:hypothetical protein
MIIIIALQINYTLLRRSSKAVKQWSSEAVRTGAVRTGAVIEAVRENVRKE